MVRTRQSYQRDWSWLYIAAFIVLAATSYRLDRQMEYNRVSISAVDPQTQLPIDYN